MSQCSDCRFWGSPPTGREYSDVPEHWGACTLSESDMGKPVLPSPMYAIDAETFHAVLVTAPDFGCASFTPKE